MAEIKKAAVIGAGVMGAGIAAHITTGGMPATLVPDFLITHFFNPPRYMRLLEVVASPKTRKDAVDTISAFCDVRLGKGVVACKDTPGFIANRIGTYWLQLGLVETLAL